MEGLEERLQAVLNDPQQMQQVFEMARSMGLGLPDQPQESQPNSQSAADMLQMAAPMLQMFQKAGKLEPRQENLLNAIKPFLKPGRREKIDRAMQVAQLSHLAGFALRSRGETKT